MVMSGYEGGWSGMAERFRIRMLACPWGEREGAAGSQPRPEEGAGVPVPHSKMGPGQAVPPPAHRAPESGDWGLRCEVWRQQTRGRGGRLAQAEPVGAAQSVTSNGVGVGAGICFNFHSDGGGGASPLDPLPPSPGPPPPLPPQLKCS